MDKLGVIAWFVIAMPVSTVVDAFALSRVWRWFLSAQYGGGPSLGAWFGVSVIAVLLTLHLPHRKMPDEATALWKRSALQLAWVASVLAVVYAVGAIFGWAS